MIRGDRLTDLWRCPMCAHSFDRHGGRGCNVVMMLNAGACRCTMTQGQLYGPTADTTATAAAKGETDG
jgi:hypothetical protein